MSRAYQISVKESVKDNVRVKDGVCSNLELLEILPEEQTGEILAGALEEKGFERDGDVMRRNDDGVEVSVDLKTLEVKVSIEMEKEVEKEKEQKRTLDEDFHNRADETEKLANEIKNSLKNEIEKEREAMSDEIATRLEEHLNDLKKELDQVSNKVTSECLKEKAKTMGEIETITEDEDTGNMTIKVRV